MLFERFLFTFIDKLVCVGGTFEGFAPFVHGENADPHKDSKFKNM